MCDTFQVTAAPNTDRTRLTHSLVLLLPAVLFGLLVSIQWLVVVLPPVAEQAVVT